MRRTLSLESYQSATNEKITKDWLENSKNFINGWARVHLSWGKNWTLINPKGEFYSDKDYLAVGNFIDGYVRIQFHRSTTGEHILESEVGMNFLSPDGKLLFDETYDYLEDFSDGFALCVDSFVSRSKFYPRIQTNFQFVMRDGKPAFDPGDGRYFICSKAESFKNGYAYVEKGSVHNIITTTGTFIFENWQEYDDGEKIVRKKLQELQETNQHK